ncbi:D-2-hydroxyglutarate dehydrogenase YdiJ [Pseudidiomarina homiensis]|uniref:D-2-hydroxyglutarate dehydrogenase YdiJ n=1 Tax=Pseudidiomarina homiensis TaxID=364198 RepID=UPI00215A629D|nr:FAD-binding oxidoreductase [Pseudidiomarina homiensis]
MADPVVRELTALDDYPATEPVYRRYVFALTQAGFAGDIDDSYAGRLIAATDNSVYQQLPQAVIYPRHREDLQKALQLGQEPDYQSLSFSPRGGGTGTNGQSLSNGIIVDLSRYFNGITETDTEAGWVRCQTGVVKDALNDAVRVGGWFFSPDLSTSNRATIGGMINTDASGQGSLVYGKTSDHILELEAVLINGEVINTTAIPLKEAERLAAGDSLEAALYRQALASCVEKRQAIEAKFPPLNRFLTGYDLKHCYDPEQQTLDLSRLLAGSEGTLAFITEAKLNLTRIPRHKVLVNISYRDFDAALRHAPVLVKAQATSVETIDSTVLDLARNDIIWHQVRDFVAEGDTGEPMAGINMVEYTAVEAAELEEKLATLLATLDSELSGGPATHGVVGYKVCRDSVSIQTVYAMRKKSVGLLGAVKGERKPIAFAEDTAVPPDALADFITEFRQLLDAHDLHYGMFGHVDAGVLHVRPALDMKVPEDEALLRKISDQVAALTAKYGGLMWGEHGKGYRSEYAPTFFGAELYPELQKIKAAFDPDNRLNPGKLATPFGHATAQLVSVDARKRGYYDRQIPATVREDYQAAMNCNGNGLCFNYAPDSPMCPSFKATGDRRMSPKGRASLIREWLRLNSEQGLDVSQSPKPRAELLKERKPRFSRDFNHQVKASMDACLACKACASQCPVKVDVPSFRAKFLAWYYQLYRRPQRDYLVASIERTAPLMARLPRLFNTFTHNPLSQWLMQKTLGYVDTPKLSVPSLHKRWRQQQWSAGSCEDLLKLSRERRQQTVVIVQDPFTSFYQAEVVEAFGRVITKLGYQPYLLDFIGNGKAQHVKGFLSEFTKTATRVTRQLNQLAQADFNLVGVDASTVLCLRDEYLDYAEEQVAFEVQLPQEWLAKAMSNSEQERTKPEASESAELFLHCTEQTALPTSAKLWQQVLRSVGVEAQAVATGCCGMAGTYGHEAEQQKSSRKLFDLSWREPLAASQRPLVTGFSCRCQAGRFADNAQSKNKKPQQVQHPLQLLAERLN